MKITLVILHLSGHSIVTYFYKIFRDKLLHKIRTRIQGTIDSAVRHNGMFLEEHCGARLYTCCNIHFIPFLTNNSCETNSNWMKISATFPIMFVICLKTPRRAALYALNAVAKASPTNGAEALPSSTSWPCC